MSCGSDRVVPRDSVMYTLFRSALSDYAKSHGIVNHMDYFASVLGYESKTKGGQLLSSIGDVTYRKFALDEFCVLINILGPDSSAVISRMLEGTGLVCLPSSAPKMQSLESFSALHLIKSGELAKSILDSLNDGELSKKEKVEIYEQVDALIGFLSSLRSSVEDFDGRD